jgi:hypothetical protein
MRKDWKMWSIYINAHHLHNWSIGLDYYHEYAYIPNEIIARIFQINLLFFNITITRWSRGEVFPGV